MTEKASISVIIPTKDRPDDLSACFDSLRTQTLLPNEVLVIDGALHDLGQERIMSSFKGVSYYHYPESSGLTASRNFGVKKATGDIVIFLDDDLVLEEDFVKKISEIFMRNDRDEIGGVMGNITNHASLKRTDPLYWIRKLFLLRMNGSGKFRISGAPTFVYGAKDILRVEMLAGGITAYRAEVLKEFAFDEKLKGPCYGEDVDFSYRLSRKYKNIYTPYARALHKHSAVSRRSGVKVILAKIGRYWYLARKNLSILSWPFTAILSLGVVIEAGYLFLKNRLGRYEQRKPNEKRLKLCFIGDTYQVHSRRWIEWFIKRGHEVSVISVRGELMPIAGCQIHDISRLPLLLQIPAAYRLIRKIKPDILHAHTLTRAGWLAAFTNFYPFILTPWGSDTFLDAKKNAVYRSLAKFTFRRADLITFNSNMLKKAIMGFGISDRKIRAAQWGIELDVFKPGLDTSQLRNKLGLKDEIAILSLRNFFPKYNITTIIRAIPQVLKYTNKVKFILKSFYRDPNYENEIRKLISELAVEKHVIFVSDVPREELALYYNLCDIALSVPFTDSISQSFLDAMACGSALVVTDLESTKEWIQDGVNGLIVQVGDHKTLADAVVRLLTDDKLRARIIDNNYKFIRKKGDQGYWMNKVEGYYKDLVT